VRVAIDTGGTFTDCAYLADGEIKVIKLRSTPADPAQAVLEGLRQISAGQPMHVRHGTTVGTNTMLERTGARVAFVTTAGFEDTIAIGRQTRARLYDWFAPVPECLVSPALRFGVEERVSREGAILLAPSDQQLAALVDQVRASGAESVAISLLFGFANPVTERRVEAALSALGLPVSASHRILPEFREYERGSTTVVNAYLAPRMERYLTHLEQSVAAQHAGSRVDVMQSSGGILPANVAAREPVRTVLSGPAGGVVGACAVARWAGIERIIGFDMGGTSTDVFLSDGSAMGTRLSRESVVAGVPIGVPMLDIHTAGAGGGSVARFDAGGMLRVGPESAGADPGPICFGRGARPTVTDANLMLGRMDPGSFLAGGVPVDRERTERFMETQMGTIETVEEFSAGILRVVEAEMAKAIRVISIERGYDPREFTLVAFGGGGPLHACSLARALRIPTVLIPAAPGALSAVGILLADAVRDFSRTVMLPGSAIENLGETFLDLEQHASAEFSAEGLDGQSQRSVDMRYMGQAYDLNVAWSEQSPAEAMAAFHQLHKERYGFCDPARPVQIVNLRVRIVAVGEPYAPPRLSTSAGDGHAAGYAERPIYFDGQWLNSHFYRRDQLVPGNQLRGPALITEYSAATVLAPGDQACVDSLGNLIISIASEVVQ
jgi:N-methylhydantoinase A